VGVTRSGRFPSVSWLAEAVNPEFMGKSGNKPELTAPGLGVGIVPIILWHGENARCPTCIPDLITRRPAAPIRPSLH